MALFTGGSGGATGSSAIGFQWDYVEQTSDLTVSAVTSATAQAFLTGNAVTYDGTAVYLSFWIPSVTSATGILIPALYDGATDLTLRLGQGTAGNNGVPYLGAYRFTPAIGSHTYSIKLWRATANVTAAGNGSGIFTPAHLRIVKA